MWGSSIHGKVLLKAYVITTGAIFFLVILAHILRVAAEGTRLLKEPSFILTTLLATGLCVWALLLLRRSFGRS
jgi:hypothetical protein